MAYERSEPFAEQFGAYVQGVPLRQAVAIITPGQVAALRATPVTVLESIRVPAGAAVVPVRAALFKASGDAFVVPNGTNFKLRWIGITVQDLFHLELDPVTLGVGQGLDQSGEFAAMFSGPSFSFAGAAQVLVVKSPAIAAEGLGLQIYNSGAAEITSVGLPLTLWIWYHFVPVRLAG